MTRESFTVFTKFCVVFSATLILMILVNSLARTTNTGTEAPWRTFNPTKSDVHEGRVLMERNGCFSCHSVDGFGGDAGPVLNGVRDRKNREELFSWIRSPFSIKPGTRMPQYHLADETILKIISYLETKDSPQTKP